MHFVMTNSKEPMFASIDIVFRPVYSLVHLRTAIEDYFVDKCPPPNQVWHMIRNRRGRRLNFKRQSYLVSAKRSCHELHLSYNGLFSKKAL